MSTAASIRKAEAELPKRAPRELAALYHLARLYGVQTSYVDMEKQQVRAGRDSLLVALRGLGAAVAFAADIDGAVRERLRSLWSWRLEPVQLAWEGTVSQIELRLPIDELSGTIEGSIRLEDGTQRDWNARLEDLPQVAVRDIAGIRHVAVVLPVSGSLPLGYHAMTAWAGGHELSSTVIAAPNRAYARAVGKEWGVFMPLYALHSRRSAGIGDLTDLKDLIAWASDQGASFVGTLPLLASFLDEPFDPSPYAPMSRLFWNEIFIDPAPEAGAMKDVGQAAAGLNAEPLVPYRVVMALKRGVLEEQASTFTAGDTAFASFLKARPEVEDYARFRSALTKLGSKWRSWPEPARQGALTTNDCDESAMRYYSYAQWRVEAQMKHVAAIAKEAGTELYLDLPVGVHSGGYDAWRYQHQFVSGMSVGAPPDIVTTSGQNWGFEPLQPEAMRRAGYDYVRAYLGHHMGAAGMLRIDHAMGLHRLYWIPQGAGARDGVYVNYPADEMYAVHCLESHRHQSAIAGENLGIVPVRVNDGLAKHGIAKMYVMSIELRQDERQPFRPIPRGVVASFGTHDLPLFAAFWQESDIEDRVRLGVLDPDRAKIERRSRTAHKKALVGYLRSRGLLSSEARTPAKDGTPPDVDMEDIFRGLLAVLADSKAERVIVNLEDLWLEAEPQNVPGTLDHQYPNWRRRTRYGLEEIPELAGVREAVEIMRRLRPSAPSVEEAATND